MSNGGSKAGSACPSNAPAAPQQRSSPIALAPGLPHLRLLPRLVPAGFDVAVLPTELGSVSVKFEFVLVANLTQRLVSHRPNCVVGQVPHIAKLSPAVASAIFSPTGDIESPPRAVTITPYRPLDSSATAGFCASALANCLGSSGRAVLRFGVPVGLSIVFIPCRSSSFMLTALVLRPSFCCETPANSQLRPPARSL